MYRGDSTCELSENPIIGRDVARFYAAPQGRSAFALLFASLRGYPLHRSDYAACPTLQDSDSDPLKSCRTREAQARQNGSCFSVPPLFQQLEQTGALAGTTPAILASSSRCRAPIQRKAPP
jgi:hypothetical protein